MVQNNLTIMVVDNEAPVLKSIVSMLEVTGYTTLPFISSVDALAALRNERNRYDIIITDLNMPGMDGFHFIEKIRSLGYVHIPILVLTGFGSIDSAVKAVKIGANSYFEKDKNPELLLFEIKKISELLRMKDKVTNLEKILEERDDSFYLFSFKNKKVNDLFASAQYIASKNVNVLITGENGTGKSILARYIHKWSDYGKGAFLAVNCSAIPDALFESEMFGHSKGAFTGAAGQHLGYFEQVAGGTLLLDEIGEMSLINQVKLLKVLEEGKFQPVGGRKEIQSSCRILVATNKNLKEAVENGDFRQDLYFRINTIEFAIPPLRERKEDIPDFIDKYIRIFNLKYQESIEGISPEAKDYLIHYSWPGNIRELKHVIERCVLFSRDTIIDMNVVTHHGLGVSNTDYQDNYDALSGTYKEAKRRFEREYFQALLSHNDNSISKIAEFSDLDRSYVYRKLKELQLPE